MNKYIDPETTAMQQVAASLADLPKEVQERIADWTMKRYGGPLATIEAGERVSAAVTAKRKEQTANSSVGGKGEYAEFAELFDAASPETGSSSALIGGYWLQVCQGRESFASQEVNDLLKHQGHPVKNITRAFTDLRECKPRFVLQLQKTGKSRQARKTMKLTLEGIRKVERMLKGEAD